MHNFDYNQMLHFIAVAKHKSFTKASNILNISQPALSRSIQKLELSISNPLFKRLPKGLKLTPAGSTLLKRAYEIKDLVELTQKEIEEVKEKAVIKLAVIPTIAPYLLPNLLKEFNKKNFNIKIQVREDTTENIITSCKDAEIDLAIVALPINDKSLSFTPLFKEELLLLLPKGHELESKKNLELKDIEALPFISLDQKHCLSENIEYYCQRKSVSRIEIEKTNQLATIQELVSLKHGISIMPQMAKKYDKSKSRVYRSFSNANIAREIGILSRARKYEDKSIDSFKNFLIESYK